MLHHLITVYILLLTICLSAAEFVAPDQIFIKPTQTINHSSLQDFKDLLFKPSIETEIRQRVIINHIRLLGLNRLEHVKCRQINVNKGSAAEVENYKN